MSKLHNRSGQTTAMMALGTVVVLGAVGGGLAKKASLDIASRTADSRPSAAAVPVEARSEETIDLAFVTHLDAELPEQDVFIEREEGSDEVWRVTRGDNDMGAPLYKAAKEVHHDPFNPDALGPYPKGEAMGMTLGDWLRQQGSGTYSCIDGTGSLDARFTGLVPEGVYTMWHAFMALPPTTPFSGTLDLPLGARDGSTSEFQADTEGRANFTHTFQPCLQMSDVWTTSMLAINYHSDGKTYRANPGKFGYNAHIPLFLMLPPREGIQ